MSAPLGLAPLVVTVFIHCERAPEAYAGAWNTAESALRQLFVAAKRLWTIWLQSLPAWTLTGPEADPPAMDHLSRLVAQVAQCAQLMLPLDFITFGKTVSVMMELTQRLPPPLCAPEDVLALWPKLAGQASQLVTQVAAFVADPGPKCPELTMVIFAFKVIDKLATLFHGQWGGNFEAIVALIADCITLRVSSVRPLPNAEKQKLAVDLPGWIQSALKSLMHDPDFVRCMIAGPPLASKGGVFFNYLLVGAEILLLMAQIEEDARPAWFTDENTNLLNSWLTWSNLCGESFEKLHDFSPFNAPSRSPTGEASTESVYVHVLLRVQSFITTMTEREFRVVESVLMHTILNTSPVQSNLDQYWKIRLTLDIWSFLVRFAPPDICQSHVCLLLEIALNSQFHTFPMVPMTVRRLGAFLNRKAINELEGEYALAKDPRHLIALRCLPNLSTKVRSSILDASLAVLDHAQSYCTSLSQFELLLSALAIVSECDEKTHLEIECLCLKVIQHFNASPPAFDSPGHVNFFIAALYRLLERYWSQMNEKDPQMDVTRLSPCFYQIKTMVDQNSFKFDRFANVSSHFKSSTISGCIPMGEKPTPAKKSLETTASNQDEYDLSSLVQECQRFIQMVKPAINSGQVMDNSETRLLIEDALRTVETCAQGLKQCDDKHN
ncbi:uncharacterized protein LOC131882891 isoform X2 [Tigriopus californicus]|nr:uncharacterized protein LOC131882891 isoform X2 [Tigriopus californicus]